ncbi:hypothetical protein CB0940_00778, partial [Cercospora beticola]
VRKPHRRRTNLKPFKATKHRSQTTTPSCEKVSASRASRQKSSKTSLAEPPQKPSKRVELSSISELKHQKNPEQEQVSSHAGDPRRQR